MVFFKRVYAFFIVFIYAVDISFLPLPVHAVIYQPGETLNPSCAPTDANCGVAPPLVLSSATTTVTAVAPTLTAMSSSPSTFPLASTIQLSVDGGTSHSPRPICDTIFDFVVSSAFTHSYTHSALLIQARKESIVARRVAMLTRG